MRICVLNASYELSNSAFKGLDPAASPARYGPEHQWHHAAIDKAKAVSQVRQLVREGLGGEPFDVFVNLCDGAWDEDRAGIEVVQTLEQLGQAFTGAGSEFYEPSRETMKRACHYAGIGQPAWVLLERGDDIDRAAHGLRFPVIVKHPSSYGSIGMTRHARCETVRELQQAVAEMVAQFGGALVEEFIEGREFTVLVGEPEPGSDVPRTWEPVEFRFPPGETFKHFDLKWVDYDGMSTHGVRDPELALRLRTESAHMFKALGGSGYGRCDLRMDAAGNLYMLEINPNCGIFYPPGEFGSADFILANSAGAHAGFLQHIIASALRRQQRLGKPTKVVFDPRRGFGMVATRDLQVGDVVQPGEAKPHALVSRPFVERNWDPQNRRWFQQYAWPLTGSVHVMWAERPEDWQPIDHSCDPNCWLDGLDLVARRPIARGEALTMDYATFCGPEMQPFDCQCGATVDGVPACRQVITATDCFRPEIVDRYGRHVSDFVLRARLGAGIAQEIGLDPRVHIDRSGDYRSLTAVQRIARGSILSPLGTYRLLDHPDRYTVQVSATEHILLEPYWLTYINHGCDPNVILDVESRQVQVIRDIEPGQAVTFFYPSTELRMAERFQCRCGSPQCLGTIGGAQLLTPQERSRYYLAAHVRAALQVQEPG